MAVLDVIKERRSYRSFDDKKVEEEKLDQVLEAGRLSPSGMNKQPWTFIVVNDSETKSELNEATNQTWNPDILIVGCAFPDQAWVRDDGEEYWKVDVAIAMQSMCLVASDLGLSTCWVCAFDEKAVKETLEIPDDVRVVSLMALGYSSLNKGKVTKRKPHEEIFKYNSW